MSNSQSTEKKYTYDNEFGFFKLFAQSFIPINTQDQEIENFLNSTKIRHLMTKADSPAISLKTYDAGIRSLNQNLPYNSSNLNPVFQCTLKQNDTPIHKNIFFHRLYYCLNLNLYGSKLYNEQHKSIEEIESNRKINSLLKLSFIDNNPSLYTFDIHNFYMPPLFVPLFVGIVGSITREKFTWSDFRKKCLDISDFFYNENHLEINRFLPEDSTKRKELWSYWLELFFPDDLFNLMVLVREWGDKLFLTKLTVSLLSLYPGRKVCV